jgi:hypothetical protein
LRLANPAEVERVLAYGDTIDAGNFIFVAARRLDDGDIVCAAVAGCACGVKWLADGGDDEMGRAVFEKGSGAA